MTARAAAALETRAALLDAGLEIAEQHGLSGMSVNRVVAVAGVAKGTFYVHFPDRDAFLSALHQRFHEQSGQAVAAALGRHAPGRIRLQAAMTAYFEVCLSHRGVKALVLEARNTPGVAAEVADRNAAFAALAEPDLRAMGWPEAGTAVRLVVAMCAELAMAELAAGERDERGRQVLWQLLTRLDLNA
ncbi:TetR/AcrR family transcriptional regulator [Streptacidiphilus sp. P02-A3a]|uniref:TetR/AcrR family transcriptional regulator n=1 Tax=Streptacidiphilus sp. P02-A3a TaxID=2704468 RepID=UPI0015F82281|nr:TetR/AcrR family transcriptional regulator [Streptacidiphilus sp. P02-A3a]QMU67054.1 helix-turn-helix transcriptional regulator [Streptacidiphilus sp. P02-A3a]